MASTVVELSVKHNVDEFRRELSRIRRESDFSQVVLEGISHIQRFQRAFAPKGRGNIGRSIRPARVVKQGSSSWHADSKTNYGPAIFTNEGTGLHGPKGSTYEIIQRRQYKSGPRKNDEYEINITHPGVRGTHWWERGMEAGSPLALEAFKRKVDRVLRTRSGR